MQINNLCETWVVSEAEELETAVIEVVENHGSYSEYQYMYH